MIPRVTRGEELVYKTFYDPAVALRELEMTRVLSHAMIGCLFNYSEDLRHVVVFKRGTPLEEVMPSLGVGLSVFSDLMKGLGVLHDVFGVTHNAVSPRHVVMDKETTWKLIDSKHVAVLGAPQRLTEGMWGGFTCADAILGGQRIQERHAFYSAAVTALWAIRRARSFCSVRDPLYVTGKALIGEGDLEKARSVWLLQDAELPLLPHLVGGFEEGVVDFVTKKASSNPPPEPRVAKDSTLSLIHI